MTDQEFLGLIREALKQVAPARTAEFQDVDLDTRIGDLAMDSVATLELVGVLEDRVARTIPDDELPKVRTLRDLAALVRTGRVEAA